MIDKNLAAHRTEHDRTRDMEKKYSPLSSIEVKKITIIVDFLVVNLILYSCKSNLIQAYRSLLGSALMYFLELGKCILFTKTCVSILNAVWLIYLVHLLKSKISVFNMNFIAVLVFGKFFFFFLKGCQPYSIYPCGKSRHITCIDEDPDTPECAVKTCTNPNYKGEYRPDLHYGIT